ncbi:hypothetical protein BgiBS90_018455 [Biomphalaria glabrata]|nr:hypothetical protein BgiBS90_018455 [Biomphalaria glabrata]
MHYLILIVVSATILPLVCEAISCASCQQLANKECQDPISQADFDTYNGDCGDDNVCVKMTTIVKIRDSGYIQGWERASKVVSRYCEAKSGKPDGCRGWQNNGGITIKCYCSTDGCNSSHFVSPSLVSFVVSIAVALFLSLHVAQH